MARPTATPLEARIRQARRRLIVQSLLNRVGVAWGLALAATVVWFLVEPIALPAAPEWLRWAVLGGLAGVGTVLAIWLVRRAAPTPIAAALALDQRFELQERTTTAVGLRPAEQGSMAGQALMADANSRLEKVRVPEKFPVRVGWRAAFLPLLAGAVIALTLFPIPVQRLIAGGGGKDGEEEGKAEDSAAAAKPAAPRTFIKPPPERPNKSEELRKLEAELEKLYAEHNDKAGTEKEKPEQTRERQEKIASAEERLEKKKQEMQEKFQKLQEQMDKATELENGEARTDGPAKEFEEALRKGDLKKAEEEADRLKKKAKDKKLDQKETEQLKKQLDEMEDRLDRLNREQKKKKEELKEKIEQAKKENRDAESLERELQKMEQESKPTPEMQELAKSLKQARQCLEQQDFDGLSEQLGDVAKQLGDIQDGVEDLQDLEEHLQNLKQMKKEGCEACKGDGKKKGEGGDKDNAQGYAEGASGKRAENKDAKTGTGEDQRTRGFFDPKGKKSYGGAVNGPAFKKATTVEMEGEIRQAVQEAPEAVEVQRLPKATKDLVKEYFEKLGGQNPGGKK